MKKCFICGVAFNGSDKACKLCAAELIRVQKDPQRKYPSQRIKRSLLCPDDLWNQLKAYSKVHDIPMSEIICLAIVQYLGMSSAFDTLIKTNKDDLMKLFKDATDYKVESENPLRLTIPKRGKYSKRVQAKPLSLSRANK